MKPEIKRTFSENSTSYYYSSLIFPREVREDVFKLYAYVRVADDYVDDKPQQPEKLQEMRDRTFENWESGKTGDLVIDSFLETARENGFEREWVDAFLTSMEMDLEKSNYESMEETLKYIHGSAEVIGLMMVRILDLDEKAERHAKLLGRSMQYCNFLRDVKEDQKLGRGYIPDEEMKKHGLDNLENPESQEYREFIRSEVERYRDWQEEAEKGMKYIPYRVRVPVILSSRIYRWTAEKIYDDPSGAYRDKKKPGKLTIARLLLGSLPGRP